MKRTVEQLLAAHPSDVQVLFTAARQSLQKWLPDIEETVDDSVAVIGYGYRGTVCTLILSKSGLKLGIVRGAELADPHHLLEGSGKVHRYIQLRTVTDLRKPGVSQLVKTALKAWKARQQSKVKGSEK